ncbi:hypothetical protein CWI38_0762p0020 [Hamiltosporidium tvaerminnensis]|uniref:Uncharacterized protein n=1 Tax=Hamiltosporidium tvaerminnensis TaxID=1176355 RepID=A0A4Q9LUS7_9MICR|nr:hypothetical protein CWI38_0762p0020 [Hamiltosporidium tvaerminnensis]
MQNSCSYYYISHEHYNISQSYPQPSLIFSHNLIVQNPVDLYGSDNYSYLFAHGSTLIQNEIQNPYLPVTPIPSQVYPTIDSFFYLQQNENVPMTPQSSYKKLKKTFEAVLLFTSDSDSNLPAIEIFLDNNYLLYELFKINSKKSYLKFIRNIFIIENRLNENRFNFSRNTWEVFVNELNNIDIFAKSNEMLLRNTFLILLKNFVKDKLQSMPLKKRCGIFMFMAMKSIESILILTKREKEIALERRGADTINSIFTNINSILRNNSNIMMEIIVEIFNLGFYLNENFFLVLNITKIGINLRSRNSFVTRFNSTRSFSIEFITDLIFQFDSEEITKIASLFNLSNTTSNQFTNMNMCNPENFLALEKLMSEKYFVIKTIRYYFSIFQDAKSKFLDTNIAHRFVREQYHSLITRFKALISENCPNVEQDLHELRLDTYYFFHFVLNYCHNHSESSEKYLKALREPYSRQIKQ